MRAHKLRHFVSHIEIIFVGFELSHQYLLRYSWKKIRQAIQQLTWRNQAKEKKSFRKSLCGEQVEKWEVLWNWDSIKNWCECSWARVDALHAVKKGKFVLSQYLNFYSCCHSHCVHREVWKSAYLAIWNAF